MGGNKCFLTWLHFLCISGSLVNLECWSASAINRWLHVFFAGRLLFEVICWGCRSNTEVFTWWTMSWYWAVVCSSWRVCLFAIVIFTARLYASAIYAVVVCPSVCPSVTSQYCTKTAKRRKTTPRILVFLLPKISAKLQQCHPLWGRQ